MDELTEVAWRKALKVKGKDWVMAELHTRPGRPDDPLYEVVFTEPLPSRQFCRQWCAEEENRFFRMSWHNYATIFAMVLFIVCVFKGVQSWNEASREQAMQPQGMSNPSKAQAGGTGQAATQNTDALSNDIPTGAGSSATSATSASGGGGGQGPLTSGQSGVPGQSPLTSDQSGVAGSAAPSRLSICAYATYPTARCPMQN
jgi:hypothetical protein